MVNLLHVSIARTTSRWCADPFCRWSVVVSPELAVRFRLGDHRLVEQVSGELLQIPVNVCLIHRDCAAELIPVFLNALRRAGTARGQSCELHIVEGSESVVPEDWQTATVAVYRRMRRWLGRYRRISGVGSGSGGRLQRSV